MSQYNCLEFLKGYRILEAGIVSQVLIRMHPEYKCGFKCHPITDNTNLQLDKEDYHKPVQRSAKILWRLMKSIILAGELPDSIRNLKPPSQAEMWYLHFFYFVVAEK